VLASLVKRERVRGNMCCDMEAMNMKEVLYSEIVAAVKAIGGKYAMDLMGIAALAVRDAVNQGIDSHLEACFMPDRGDRYDMEGGRLVCEVSAESMPVLLRRLQEKGHEDDEMLARDILEDLGVLLESDESAVVISDEEVFAMESGTE